VAVSCIVLLINTLKIKLVPGRKKKEIAATIQQSKIGGQVYTSHFCIVLDHPVIYANT